MRPVALIVLVACAAPAPQPMPPRRPAPCTGVAAAVTAWLDVHDAPDPSIYAPGVVPAKSRSHGPAGDWVAQRCFEDNWSTAARTCVAASGDLNACEQHLYWPQAHALVPPLYRRVTLVRSAAPPAGGVEMSREALAALLDDKTTIPTPDYDTITDARRNGKSKIYLLVRMCIDTHGTPTSILVTQTSHDVRYDTQVVATLAAWRLRPHLVDGVPTSACGELPVVFSVDSHNGMAWPIETSLL